jgi:hypothetical protein
MVGAQVQRIEVEPLGLHLGPLGDLPAHRDEDVPDELLDRGQRMPRAAGLPVPGEGDVDGLLDEDPRLVLHLEGRLAGGQRLVHRAPGLADAHPGVLAGLRWQRPDLPVRQRQGGPVGGVLDPDPLELVEVAGRLDRGQRRLPHRVHLVGLQRGDLDRVVIGVRAGHGCLSVVVRTGEV